MSLVPPGKGSLKSLLHYGPVTCLRIISNFIVAGYGPILKVFLVDPNTDSIQLIYACQLFKANKIHCIAVADDNSAIAIAGSRSFAIVPWSHIQAHTAPSEHAINEWITNIAFLDTNTLLILDSHNSIYRVNLSLTPFTKEPKIDCSEKSLLYSGSIRVLPTGQVLVAAGTVLHGIIIWDLETRLIVRRLTAHEGSIFGVVIDAAAQYVVSCSDDRSVKLYDFSSGDVLATGWGHGSRIWSLSFFSRPTSSLPRILSVGEDGSARIWQYHADNETLEQVQHWDTCHLGKHVWSGDVDNAHLNICVTGGADGRIRVHDLQMNNGTFQRYTLADLAFPSSQETIKQFFRLPLLDTLILVTSHGQVLLLNEQTRQVSSIELSESDKLQLTGFSVLKGFKSCETVVVAARNGDLLLITMTPNLSTPNHFWVRDNILGKNKVTNILVHSDKSQGKLYVLTDSPNPSIPFVLRVFVNDSEGFRLAHTLKLAQPQQTSFTTTRMSIDSANGWLVLASRYATLAVYKLTHPLDTIPMFLIHKKIIPGDSITACELVSSHPREACLFLAVRDGVYAYVTLKETDDSMSLDVNHQNKLSRGVIEGAFFDMFGNLMLYGFKSSMFYIWNETRQLEVASEACGGAHREWALFRNEDADSDTTRTLQFAYISKTDLCVRTFKSRFRENHYGLINNGTHGREIRSIAISPHEWSQSGRLIATAAEDTTIRISLVSSTGQIESLWSMNNHVSGLQKVKFVGSNFLVSCAANEELFIWQITSLPESTGLPLIKEYARLAPLCADTPDLRIMDFATRPIEDGFLMCTVYSDSAIKIWHFNTASGDFHLIERGHYTSCCILNVNFLEFGDKTWLQITTTDGYLSMWDISAVVAKKPLPERPMELGSMLIKQQLHQNGVKAVLNIPRDKDFLVVTGGDDNALVLTKVTYNDGSLQLHTQLFIESAASATITSISLGSLETIVVTSVDQVVRVWSFADLTLECISSQYTTVADTGCSDSCNIDGKTIVAVGGAGLSLFEQTGFQA